MEVGNEMEIFIISTKYNTCPSGMKKVTVAKGDYLVNFHYLLHAPPNEQV